MAAREDDQSAVARIRSVQVDEYGQHGMISEGEVVLQCHKFNQTKCTATISHSPDEWERRRPGGAA